MFYNIKKQTDEKYGIKRKYEDLGFLSAKQMLENRTKKSKPADKGQSTLETFFKSRNAEKTEEREVISDNDEVSSSTDTKPEERNSAISPVERCEEKHIVEPCEVPEINVYLKAPYKSNIVNDEDIRQDKDKNNHRTRDVNAESNENNGNLEKEETEKGIKKMKGDKQKIGQFIVQLLMPAYTQKKFTSKDVFKSVARKITHDVMNKDLAGNVPKNIQTIFILH